MAQGNLVARKTTKRPARHRERIDPTLPAKERKSKKARFDFMETARSRFAQGESADEGQRVRELEAKRFAAGDQWPADIVTIRKGNDGSDGRPKAPARPMLTVNQVLEPLNQLLAQMSGADLGFELVSADDFRDLIGDVDESEILVREGLARRIQRDSQAIEARLWGADSGNTGGRGYWAVLTRFVQGKSFDQEIYIHKIYNQASVLLDPNRENFDGSDADWGFISHDMPADEYDAEFGEVDGKANEISDCTNDEFRALGDDYPDWFSESEGLRSYRVVDYYYVVREVRALVMIDDGSVAWEDETPKDAVITDRRDVIERKVKWAKLDGYQVLDETDWQSPYLPIIEYVAHPIQPYDAERRAQGLVEPMIDAGRGFNYMLSRWVEQVGLSPLRTIMMAAGQDEGFEFEWDNINTRSGRVHFNQTDLNGRPAGEPKVPPSGGENIGPISGAIQVFKDAIYSTTQSHGPSQGEADPALRSAKAINAVISNDQRGDSNIITRWASSVRHEGRVVNSLLYPIYGVREGRLASIIDPDGKQQTIALNQPFTMQGAGKTAKPIKAVDGDPSAKHFKLTKDANFNVVVKVTKNFETLRQEFADQLGKIISADPQLMTVLGDLFFANQDGPGHKELADRMKVMLDPKVQATLQAKAQGMDIPPPVQAHISQLTQQLQQAQQLLQHANQVIQTDQVKMEGDLKKTKMTVDKDILIHQMDNAAKIEAARISASKQAADPGAESQEELLATGLQMQHEAAMANLEHQHSLEENQQQAALDARASAQDHSQALAQGDQQHAQAIAQGQQGIDGQMATAQQQAALAPPPTEGATE